MFRELWFNRANITTHFKNKIQVRLAEVNLGQLGWLLLILLILIIIYSIIRYLSWSQQISKVSAIEGFDTNNQHDYPRYEPNTIQTATNKHTNTKTMTEANINFVQPGDRECSRLQAYISAKYLIYMNQPNIQARGFDTLAELNDQYRTGICQMITEEEQTGTTEWVRREIANLTDPKFREIATRWISGSWLCKAQPWLEGGMPHTHDRMILMRPEWFQVKSEPSKTDIGILWHEMTHIWQRLAPQDFTGLFTKWGFRQIPLSHIPKGLEPILVRSRLNPDALPNDLWLWVPPSANINISELELETEKPGYWIGAVYPNVSPQSLHEIEFRAYPLTAGGNVYLGQQSIDLKDFKSFADFFGSGRNHYHPNELAAHFMDELLTGRLDTKYPGCQIFKEWLSRQS
jgi:hypothetical protein